MTSLHAPLFVLAPSGELPLEPAGWEQLAALQGESIRQAERVRLFSVPGEWSGSLQELIHSGIAAERPFCDALVPALDADSLSLGVYEVRGSPRAGGSDEPAASIQVDAIRCLDQVPLREVQNEACWFYPTEDGAYLSWTGRRRVRLRPGYLPDRPPTTAPLAYHRSRLRLLWSLMADDEEMTCVGLTYSRRRIDWPVAGEEPDPVGHWAWFTVDSAAERPYREVERRRL
jgi:hypothetical protein